MYHYNRVCIDYNHQVTAQVEPVTSEQQSNVSISHADSSESVSLLIHN